MISRSVVDSAVTVDCPATSEVAVSVLAGVAVPDTSDPHPATTNAPIVMKPALHIVGDNTL